jgi:hypothetical protein
LRVMNLDGRLGPDLCLLNVEEAAEISIYSQGKGLRTYLT